MGLFDWRGYTIIMHKYVPLATNQRARYDYEIGDRFVAGIVLHGPEVKSIRAKHVSLKGSFATFKDAELYIVNMHVSAYPPAKLANNYDPVRSRKLLLNKRQLNQISSFKQTAGSIVVLSVGLQGPYIKVELGLGRGKKQYDKRQVIMKRQLERDAKRALKGR
jgi:SsrA-binding protein